MAGFTAENIHSEASVRKLSAVQYNIFGIGKKLKIFITGAVLVAAAVFGNPGETGFFLMMMTGGWLLMSTGLPQIRQTDKLIERMNGKFPGSSFLFEEDEIIVYTGSDFQRIPYERIVTIAKDAEYYYLFISRMSAYMFPKDSVMPSGGFEEFLEEKAGLPLIKPCSILRMSFREAGLRIKNLRQLRRRKKEMRQNIKTPVF